VFQAHVNIEDLDSLEDVEHCVIYYNQAVLLYHLKKYSAALKIMHKIFSFIEPMGEKLKVCLVYCSVLGVGTVSGQIGHWAD
jgi:CCR4-NOT transcription complex subunit 10